LADLAGSANTENVLNIAIPINIAMVFFIILLAPVVNINQINKERE
jgi:hypothetical protein